MSATTHLGQQPETGTKSTRSPRVIVLTRYLPHFRREVFRRLSLVSDLDIHFVHAAEVPVGDTGISTEPLPNSHIVSTKTFGHRPLSAVYQPETLSLVRQLKPDVIVCEAPPNFLTAGLAAIHQRVHGQGVVFWTKGATSKPRGKLVSLARSRAIRTWLSLAHVLIAYGESSRTYFEGLGIAPDRIIVAQNSVDTTSLIQNPHEWAERGRRLRERLQLGDRKVIATVSRLTQLKRIDLAIEAAAQIAAERSDVTLLIGGDGLMRAELQQKATEYPQLQVHFLGKLPAGEENDAFAAADVNIFPARTGLAIVQSMALGRPTIIADELFADAELIVHEDNGLRYRPYVANDLALQINRVLQDPKLAQHLSESARQSVIEKATIENMVSRIEDAIRLALHARRVKR